MAEAPHAFASAPNLNALWSQLLIDELVRNGVRDAVVCPGSRSTPITIAAARHPLLRTIVVIDERAAGYLAVGIARAHGAPAVVITTSGTAVSNLFPAVTEADLDCVPLILVTADRPPELRDTSANQTITQPEMFGRRVRFAVDLSCPDPSIDPAYVLTTVDAAIRAASDGPVHLNVPVREPLAPVVEPWDRAILDGIAAWAGGSAPFTSYVPSATGPDDDALDAWIAEQPAHGLILCAGAGVAGDVTRKHAAADALSAATGWPVIADIRSGVRLGYDNASHVSLLATRISAAGPPPEAVLQLGRTVTAARLVAHLSGLPDVRYTVVAPGASRIDPHHRVDTRINADPYRFAHAVSTRWPRPASGRSPNASPIALAHAALEAGANADGRIDEPGVARALSRVIDPAHGLFVGSSLPIRLMDQFAVTDGSAVPVAGNRGASGIDGSIASAAGFARGLGRPVTALIGDLAGLHDLSSLALLREAEQAVTLIILNNGGGGIFRLLPLATASEFDDIFERYFATRHTHRFGSLAAGFDIPHRDVSSLEAFSAAYRDLAGTSCVIEVHVDPNDTVAAIAAYHDATAAALR